MKTRLGCGILALVLSSGAAAAQTTIITQEPAMQETIVTREPAPVLQLTPSQRTTVYRTVQRERTVAPAAAVEYRVGARIPTGVELYALPEAVVTEVPTVRQYKYMYVNNRVLLVDPATSMVVGEIAQ
jgi:hypothetical protein